MAPQAKLVAFDVRDRHRLGERGGELTGVPLALCVGSTGAAGQLKPTTPADGAGTRAGWTGFAGRVTGCFVVSGAVHDRRVSSSAEILPGQGSATPITNQRVTEHAFLQQMYEDSYFADHVVDRGRAILLRLCGRIEAEQPSDLEALYALTRAATEEFNLLEAEFEAAGSEIETTAREWIGEEFWFAASAYGFTDADAEELIAGRNR